ncbi:MAG TPA: hypothetical protein DD635_07720 [Flavobacteriales bacterium]|nr:hypothetical protein [Flavobacteriales bacterium]
MKLIQRALLLAGISCVCLHGENVRAQNISDRYTGAQIQRDLDSLAKWIIAIHPSPFVHCSSLEFEAAIESAKSTFAGGGTLYGAAQMAAKICGVLKDSHTGVALQSFSNQLGATYGHLPLEIQTVNNRLIVTTSAGNTKFIGSEIKLINDVSARSILGGALALVSQEGDAALARLRMSEKLWNDIAPFASGIGISDSVKVQYASGQTEILPILKNQEMQGWNAIKSHAIPISWKEIQEDKRITIVLKIKHFHPENIRTFRKEIKACFTRIYTLQSSKSDVEFSGLVIDLRGNSGGHIAIMAELLPYLTTSPVALPSGVQIKASEEARKRWGTGRFGLVRKTSYLMNLKALKSTLNRMANDSIAFVSFDYTIRPHRRFAYTGTAALILDGLSASATVSMASWFVRSGRGETFGEPPMGSVSGTFGNPVRLALPETSLAVNIASARYFTQTPVRWEARPLLVDHPVTPTALDIKRGTDSVMEAALYWVSQRKSIVP